MLDKLHRIEANGQRETKYTVTTKDGSVYGLSEDLYESLKLQMPEEPEEPVDIDDDNVPEDNDSDAKDDNDKKGIDLFGINPETKKIEQVTQ